MLFKVLCWQRDLLAQRIYYCFVRRRCWWWFRWCDVRAARMIQMFAVRAARLHVCRAALRRDTLGTHHLRPRVRVHSRMHRDGLCALHGTEASLSTDVINLCGWRVRHQGASILYIFRYFPQDVLLDLLAQSEHRRRVATKSATWYGINPMVSS